MTGCNVQILTTLVQHVHITVKKTHQLAFLVSNMASWYLLYLSPTDFYLQIRLFLLVIRSIKGAFWNMFKKAQHVMSMLNNATRIMLIILSMLQKIV